jgi:hypothetical protein
LFGNPNCNLVEQEVSLEPEMSPTLEEIHLELRLSPSPLNLRQSSCFVLFRLLLDVKNNSVEI